MALDEHSTAYGMLSRGEDPNYVVNTVEAMRRRWSA